MMKNPKIGDIITTQQALKLCQKLKLGYLVARIEADPEQFKNWKFDGCSCMPDKFIGLFTGCNWRDITYGCCLPHDLCYAYGELGNRAERKRVDTQFYKDLINKTGMKKWMARIFLFGVRTGGVESLGLSFSWGFARKKCKKVP